MTPDDILKGLYDETLVGNGPAVLDLTHQALSMEMAPGDLLFDALIPALEEVGARFERGDFFVPEMLIAGRAMAGSMEVLRPCSPTPACRPSASSSWARSRATCTTSARTS
ncbi:B12-binding domain-containing protein [Phycicoccus sp. HDW14]|uniref:B12-binding domain-containing protein n=1 Tax=Phycicoccus sp. HDW14 TaxID=2714941 RepID=UPI001F11489A|nr:B12-binding domain-containing protein [Phycicoccus sp. HDW14]